MIESDVEGYGGAGFLTCLSSLLNEVSSTAASHGTSWRCHSALLSSAVHLLFCSALLCVTPFDNHRLILQFSILACHATLFDSIFPSRPVCVNLSLMDAYVPPTLPP